MIYEHQQIERSRRYSWRCRLRILVALLVFALPALVPATACANTSNGTLQNPALGDSQHESSTECRLPENDAVNAIYVLARLYGAETTLESIGDRLRPIGKTIDLATVRACLEDLGIPLSAIRCPPDKTLFGRCPFVTLIEDEQSGGSNYAIVVRGNDKSVTVLHCGYVIVDQMHPDKFRRAWSGVALVDRNEVTGHTSVKVLTSHLPLAVMSVATAILVQRLFRGRSSV